MAKIHNYIKDWIQNKQYFTKTGSNKVSEISCDDKLWCHSKGASKRKKTSNCVSFKKLLVNSSIGIKIDVFKVLLI